MNRATRIPDDDVLVERFFARQRTEILARIGANETLRRERRTGLALAAAAAGVAILLSWTSLRGPVAVPQAEYSWAEAIALPGETDTVGDPLAAFGDWGGDQPIDADADIAALESSPLPPLSLEISDEDLSEFDELPFPLPGQDAESGAPTRG